MTTPFDQGFDLYKSEPDLMLIEVAHRVPNGTTCPRQDFLDFVDGYIAARRQRNEKEREDARNSSDTERQYLSPALGEEGNRRNMDQG